jgi:hypothetical protein
MKSYPAFRAWCDACGSSYLVPSSIPDDPEFVLSSSSLSHHVVVNNDTDSALAYMYSFVRSSPPFKSLMAVQRVRLARMIFGELCDLAPDKSAYSFYFPESCPKCGRAGLSFGPTEKPQPMLLDLQLVTHRQWDEMPAKARNELLTELATRIESREDL